MKVLFKNPQVSSPKVSILLTDWSCRESLHMLRYLNDQTVPRDQYEILWMEYYSRQAKEIEVSLQETERDGKRPLVDQWILLEMPHDVYYHKHLMYNAGILMAQGRILVICDSDVMVRPTFLESILESFERDPNIVLHLDEVRNENRDFYPFKTPTIQEILADGCLNWTEGKTKGLLDTEDPLHSRNYGACMCALREDLIEIGGADEHMDYLGHICGPYELTFRLINQGRKEIWHPSEFLYHTWHPGTNGQKNYFGPHDGYNMSLTALDIIRTGRVMPFVENPAVQMLRRGQGEISYVSPIECLICESDLEKWKVENLDGQSHHSKFHRVSFREHVFAPFGWSLKHLWIEARLLPILIRITIRQLFTKIQTSSTNSVVMKKSAWDKIRLSFVYLFRMWINNRYKVRACKLVLHRLQSERATEFFIYGSGPFVDMLKTLTPLTTLKMEGVVNSEAMSSPHALSGDPWIPAFAGMTNNRMNLENRKIIVASFTQVAEKVFELTKMGIKRKNIFRLQ